MEQRNLEKALDVYAALITGQEISRSNPDIRDLYEEFYANAAVYDDMKRLLGLRLNRELYMVYFIMYNFLLLFYQDSASYQVKEYVRLEDILEQVTTYLASITNDLSVYSMSDVEADSFKSLALLWDELPLVTSDEKDKNRASRASRTGYVKLTFNFLQEQKLFIAVEDRYYPTDRFHAIVENYFEEYKGKIYKVLGGETNA